MESLGSFTGGIDEFHVFIFSYRKISTKQKKGPDRIHTGLGLLSPYYLYVL